MPTERLPSTIDALKTLFRADLKVQWRQRRSLMMNMIMPVIFLVSWKTLVPIIGAAGVLSICMTIGLPATGLMGYSLSVARDRERGVFQRLRAAPVSTWAIMGSRLLVQISVIAVMAILTIIAAAWFDNIHLPLLNSIVVIFAAIVGGMSFLAIGQFLVAFIQGSESVSSAARLLYFPLAIVGALGEMGLFGATLQKVVIWSPFGTTKALIAAAIVLKVDQDIWLALLASVGYCVFFAGFGIRFFRWTV